MFGQQWDVFHSFSERRQFHREDAQSIEQILPKAPGLGFSPQVSIGRRDHSNVDSPSSFFTDALNFAFLKDPQQLGLQVERNLADSIKEQSAAIGEFKSPGSVTQRSRERTFGVTEEFAFVKFTWDCGAIDLDQRPLTASAICRWISARCATTSAWESFVCDWRTARTQSRISSFSIRILSNIASTGRSRSDSVTRTRGWPATL